MHSCNFLDLSAHTHLYKTMRFQFLVNFLIKIFHISASSHFPAPLKRGELGNTSFSTLYWSVMHKCSPITVQSTANLYKLCICSSMYGAPNMVYIQHSCTVYQEWCSLCHGTLNISCWDAYQIFLYSHDLFLCIKSMYMCRVLVRDQSAWLHCVWQFNELGIKIAVLPI